MIEAIFEGSKYRYCKSEKGNYWIGISGNGRFYPGAHTIAPISIWSSLQKSALSAGHSKAEFVTEKPEPKKSVRTQKKSKGPSISIF